MKRTLVILAFMAMSIALVPAQAGTAVMTNNTIQAMLAGGVSVPTIVRAIKTAPRIDLYVNDREIIALKNAGASAPDVKAILEAIHYREYVGIDTSPADPVVRPSVVPIMPVTAPKPAATVPATAPPVAQGPAIVAGWDAAAASVPSQPLATPVSSGFAPEPAGSAPGLVMSVPGHKMVLEDATPVRLRLSHNLSSADAITGQSIDFEVLEDIKIGEQVVIRKGSSARGTVTDAEAKRRMGRGGKLNVTIDSVRLTDGEKVALRGVKGGKGGGHVGAMTTEMVVTSLVLWPVAPLFLLQHGKDVTMPQGTEITAYINGDMTLDSAKF